MVVSKTTGLGSSPSRPARWGCRIIGLHRSCTANIRVQFPTFPLLTNTERYGII